MPITSSRQVPLRHLALALSVVAASGCGGGSSDSAGDAPRVVDAVDPGNPVAAPAAAVPPPSAPVPNVAAVPASISGLWDASYYYYDDGAFDIAAMYIPEDQRSLTLYDYDADSFGRGLNCSYTATFPIRPLGNNQYAVGTSIIGFTRLSETQLLIESPDGADSDNDGNTNETEVEYYTLTEGLDPTDIVICNVQNDPSIVESEADPRTSPWWKAVTDK